MVEYTPPQQNTEGLNPIQRYMQKGSLDRQDYIWLGIIALAYFSARPYIEQFFKWWMAPKAVSEGEQAQKDYMEKRAKVAPNSIRGSKQSDEEPTAIAETEKTATGSHIENADKVTNRKNQGQSKGNKPEEDKLLDWDDEPARAPTEGDKSDVMQWLNKWDKE